MGNALEAIKKLPPNTTFVLKDLFEGVEWGQLPKGERQSFGKYFKNRTTEGQISNIRYIGKA